MVKTTTASPPCNEKKMDNLRKIFVNSKDIVWKEHRVEKEIFHLIYIESIVDVKYINQFILPKLATDKSNSVEDSLETLFQAEEGSKLSVDELASRLLEGNLSFI